MIKIGNTSFQEEAIKKMTLKEFKGTYKDILKDQDLEKTYRQITGNADSDSVKRPNTDTSMESHTAE